MRNIISAFSAYVLIGVLLFSLSMFLPANAIMKDMVDTIKCKIGFSMVLKLSDKSHVCVKASSVGKLVGRGWATRNGIIDKTTNFTMTQNQSPKKDFVDKTMEGHNSVDEKNMSLNNSYQPSVNENKYHDAPALVGISNYFNTTPAKLVQEMKDKVIVYDFWTFNCINCIHTLPHVVDLSNKYLGRVLVIGVHSPETTFEQDPNNVRDAIHKYSIQYPVVMDNEFQTWNAFGNHYWPHIYIADSHGKLRNDHIGEGDYDEIDKTVENLLLEQDVQIPKEPVMG